MERATNDGMIIMVKDFQFLPQHAKHFIGVLLPSL